MKILDELGVATLWEKIKNYVSGKVFNPDDEDLVAEETTGGTSVMKLADRSYSPQNFSGKGYKILRKNIKPVSLAVTKIIVSSVPTSDGYISFIINGIESHVDVVASSDTTTDKVADKIVVKLTETMTEYEVSKDASTITLTRKFGGEVSVSSFSAVNTGASCSIADSTKKDLRNIITPIMMNQPDIIYEIRYDFDLNGETIEMQAGCTLKFEGGCLRNGILKGNSTEIDSVKKSIFHSIKIIGTYTSNFFVEYFGAIGDGNVDDTKSIQDAIDALSGSVEKLFLNGKYKVSISGNVLNDWSNGNVNYCIIIKHSISLLGGGKILYNDEELASIIFVNTNNVKISNIDLVYGEHTGTEIHKGSFITIFKSSNVSVSGCNVSGISGIKVYKSKFISIKNNFISSIDYKYSSGALIGMYASEQSEIIGNTMYGGSSDGDLSVFGVCTHIRIENNYLCAKTFETDELKSSILQGICIDSGAYDIVAKNNKVQYYFYGIDVKSNVHNCLVEDNIVQYCKVGITSRYGEANVRVSECEIKNNYILKPQDNGNETLLESFSAIGIYITGTCYSIIENNTISIDKLASDNNFVPIVVNYDFYEGAQGIYQYVLLCTIKNNNFINSLVLYNIMVSNAAKKNIVAKNELKSANLIIKDNNFYNDYATKQGLIEVDGFRNVEIIGHAFIMLNFADILNIQNCTILKISENIFGFYHDSHSSYKVSNVDFCNILNNQIGYGTDYTYGWENSFVIDEVKLLNICNNRIYLNNPSDKFVPYFYAKNVKEKSIIANNIFRFITKKQLSGVCMCENAIFENNITASDYFIKSGTTEIRPTGLDSSDEGFEYYDTTLKKKILWNGAAWVNLDGTALT